MQQPSLSSLLKSASHGNAQKCGCWWVASVCFLQGREALQSQDDGLEYTVPEMVGFNPVLFQFIMTRNCLG